MKGEIWTKICLCTIVSMQLTTATAENSTISSMRPKRSFGFGFSNPIFSRVFNPYDDRPLAAKFFGNDYAPQPTYASNFDHSQYDSSNQNYDSWSDDDDDAVEDYHEITPHAYSSSYGHPGWRVPSVKVETKPYPPHIDVLKKPQIIHTTKKKQLGNDKPETEYTFNSLPFYDIAKPFRTPEEVKNFRSRKQSPSHSISENVPVKKPVMEYIFNLLPHYEIREVFKTSSPSITTSDSFRNSHNYEKNKEYLINSVIKLSDLNHVTNSHQTEMNTMQTPTYIPNSLNLYHFKDLPRYDIDVRFREKQVGSSKPKHILESSQPGQLSLLPNYEIKTVFDSNTKQKVSSSDTKHIIDKTASNLGETTLTFVLPNYEIKDNFKNKFVDPLPFTPKPSPSLIGGENNSPILSHTSHSSFVLPKYDIGVKFAEDNIEESELKKPIIQHLFTSQIEEVTETIHENSENVETPQIDPRSNRYIPHRTKIIEAYTPFLSLPAVVVYQRFNDENHSTGQKSLNNVPSVKEATFVPSVSKSSTEASDTIEKHLNFIAIPQHLPSVTTNSKFFESQLASNPSAHSTDHHRTQFQKVEPLTERSGTDFTSIKNQRLSGSKTDHNVNYLEIPVHEFQTFRKRNGKQNSKNGDTVELEVPKENPSHFRIFEQPSTSSTLDNQLSIEDTSPATNDHFILDKQNVNPNIPQTILETLSQKNNERPKLKYITQSVIIKPIGTDLQEIPSSYTLQKENGKSKPDRTIGKLLENDIRTRLRYTKKKNGELGDKVAPSPMNSIDPEVMKVHHVRRKPPSSTDFSSTGSKEDSFEIRRRPPIAQRFNDIPQKLFKKEKVTNVSHKRVRVDTKRLPVDKQIDFRVLPYFDNKGINFRPKMVYKIIGDEDNMKVQKEEIVDPFVSTHVEDDSGKISIGDIPLEKHKIWDSNKRVLIDSYGEAMQ